MTFQEQPGSSPASGPGSPGKTGENGSAPSGAGYAVVVGGVNIDIGGTPFSPLKMEDSNPGKVTTSLGGVGRNIAHNLSLMGAPVTFLTAFGDDIYAQNIIHSCTELNIDISRALMIKGGATPVYLFINDSDHDMAAAVSDMAICDEISAEYLGFRSGILNGAQIVASDTNIPANSLAWLAEHCTAPLFVDPVSTKKAVKLKPILGKLHTLKPNRIEAELLSGVRIHDEESLKKAAGVLLDTGLKRVFISLGSDGVLAADHSSMLLIPCFPASLKSTTGAGDAFMAGLAWAHMHGLDLGNAGLFASAAAAIAVESTETINPGMSVEAVGQKIAGTPAQIRKIV
ncbi:MAG: bifunctional hydroxymethylpyrimidine kinase/phosphomethylpyrimidine kinase [Anaerolineaceae bacterium]|nr:bifunctional hydroxymethylpyrimidine kinase/phosphomethylpyrimidine kinase [Anaerolineaceae bacterium]